MVTSPAGNKKKKNSTLDPDSGGSAYFYLSVVFVGVWDSDMPQEFRQFFRV